jgi:hypothetical protein
LVVASLHTPSSLFSFRQLKGIKMRTLAILFTAMSFAACSEPTPSAVNARDMDMTYLLALYQPEGLDDAKTTCAFYSDRIEISTGTANKSGPVQTVSLSVSESREMKRLVRDAYDNETAASDFVPALPGTACNEVSLVQIADKKQGQISTAFIHFYSPCQGFAGNWREGASSNRLLNMVNKYCPGAIRSGK